MYELKLYEAVFRDLLAEHLHELDYSPSISEPDVWERPTVKPGGFIYYYEYYLFYVDGVLWFIDDLLHTMKSIQAKLELKGDKI